MSKSIPLKHIVVRASAGSGKTYCLSTNYLRLLDAGELPERILAITFTRKAAGEIRARIFSRLAQAVLKESAAKEIRDSLSSTSFTQERAAELFSRLINSQHKLALQTIDSLFAALARAFPLELGLGLNWRTLEDNEDRKLHSQAVAKTILQLNKQTFSTLYQIFQDGKATRSVAASLISDLEEMYNIYRIAPASCWKWHPERKNIPLEPEEAKLLVQSLLIPRTKQGEPNKNWIKAQDNLQNAAARGDWKFIISHTLVNTAFSNNKDLQYYRAPIDKYNFDILVKLGESSALHELNALNERTISSYALLDMFHTHYSMKKREIGAFSFADINFAIAEKRILTGLSEVYYRLDNEYRHLLLDEFQDTSLTQWEVIRPLVEEITSDIEKSRLFFCVGDVKQSIYGWRGGVPEIFDLVHSTFPSVSSETLDKSYRSSPQVIEFVNRVFSELTENPALLDSDSPAAQEAAASWTKAFHRHETTRTSAPGYVNYHFISKSDEGPDEEQDEEQDEEFMFNNIFLASVLKLARANPAISIGILVRKNSTAEKFVGLLREADGELSVSSESTTALGYSFAVQEAAAVLKLIDHPDHTASAYRISTSPLGLFLDLQDPNDIARRRALSDKLRLKLFRLGYGKFIYWLCSALLPHCNEQEKKRLQQLTSLGYSFDTKDSVRTAEFLAFINNTKFEESSISQIRVMTIHKAKGLEFDAVFLPELGATLRAPNRPKLICYSENPCSWPTRVIRNPSTDLARIVPEIREMLEREEFLTVRESFSALYVALTRARHAVYLFDLASKREERKLPLTFSGLIRGTLGISSDCRTYQNGDPLWFEKLGKEKSPAPKSKSMKEPSQSPQPPHPPHPPQPPQLHRPASQKLTLSHSVLTHKTPSSFAHKDSPFAAHRLRTDHREGLLRGSLIHIFCETISWLDQEIPSDKQLFLAASKKLPKASIEEGVIRQFRSYLEQETIRQVFSLCRYPGFESKEILLYREFPFAVRENDDLLSGAIDRLVVCTKGGKACSAEIFDFKTDRIADESFDEKIKLYRPQLEAYRGIVSRVFSLESVSCSAKLVFLSSARVVEV